MIEESLWSFKTNHKSIPQFPCPVCEKRLLESKQIIEEYDSKTAFFIEESGLFYFVIIKNVKSQ